MQEEIKSRLSQGIYTTIWCRVFCLAVYYKKINIKINRTVRLSVVFMGVNLVFNIDRKTQAEGV
jgi:hypothetical protein